MADLPPYPDSTDDTGNRESPPGAPRWVKVFGITALVLVLLVIVMMVVSGGQHGPGRHMPGGGRGGYVPPSSVTAQRLPLP